jgi:hypothetical protein
MKPLISLRFIWRSGIIHSTINMGCHCNISLCYLLILVRFACCLCHVFILLGSRVPIRQFTGTVVRLSEPTYSFLFGVPA